MAGWMMVVGGWCWVFPAAHHSCSSPQTLPEHVRLSVSGWWATRFAAWACGCQAVGTSRDESKQSLWSPWYVTLL